MMKPLVLLNFKIYPESAGKKALSLARQLSQVKSRKYEVVLAPSLLMVEEIAGKVRVPIFAQHADPVSFGAFTGKISLAELSSLGAKGVILNHSERKLNFKDLKETIVHCSKYRLKTVVCASKMREVKKIASWHPDYLAYEPPELIGGNLSVTKAKPKMITKVVVLVRKRSPKTKVLCGAGVHSRIDLLHALKLGTAGVLIGHAVPKAKDPAGFLRKMLGEF